MPNSHTEPIKVKVVGVGGAGGNAVFRMAKVGLQGVDLLGINTDVQALTQMKGVHTFAIGPQTTGGLGSGGQPEVGRKAVKESQSQVAKLLEGSDMVFITAGMGGGTGTGAASIVADIAKKQGALTVGVVSLPFSFEGPQRRRIGTDGLRQLQAKVDTIITVDNDMLLPSLNGSFSLDKAFHVADEVLRQGVQGISDIIMVPGLINVDFADVRSVMSNRGPSFMAVGEGKGKWAAIEAAHMALSNPLFGARLQGAADILFNVSGGNDLTLGQVHEVSEIIRKAGGDDSNVIFGVVQHRKMRNRVSITLVATGLTGEREEIHETGAEVVAADSPACRVREPVGPASVNGSPAPEGIGTRKLF